MSNRRCVVGLARRVALIWLPAAGCATAQVPNLGGLGGLPGVGLAPPSGVSSASAGASPMRLTLKLGTTVTLVYSSNAALSTASSGAATATADTARTAAQLVPSLNLTLRGPFASGTLNYAANVVSVVGRPEENTVLHNLRSAARVGVLEDRLGVDGALTLTQQSASAFGNPAVGGGLLGSGLPSGVGNLATALNPNQVDVLTAQVAPVVRARLAGTAQGEVRYLRSHVQRRGDNLPADGLNSQDAQALQAAVSGGEVLRWSVQALQQQQSFANGREIEASRAVATVAYPLDADLDVRLGAGMERQNLQSDAAQPGTQRSSRVLDAGVNWTPSPRTQVALNVSDRFFGTAWQATANQRFNRLSLRLSGSRVLSDGPLQVGTVAGGASSASSVTVADLYSQILSAGESDPIRRQALVDQALRQRGLDGSATLSGFTPTLSPSLQERVELGVAYVLPRQTFSLLAARSSTERILKDPLNPNEDLARFGLLQQTIVQAALTHRLTPESSLGLTYGRQRSEATNGALPVDLQQFQLNGNFRLGPRLTGVVLLREAELSNANLGLVGGGKRRDTSAAFILIPQF